MSSQGVAEYSVPEEEESDAVSGPAAAGGPDTDGAVADGSARGAGGSVQSGTGSATAPVSDERQTPGVDQGGSNDGPARGEAEPDTQELSTLDHDDVFEVLSNRRRRLLLHYLRRYDGDTVELSELSSQLAAWEQGTSPERISYADRKNVHTALYQFHLPKMEESGFVDYDQRSGRVGLTAAARDLDVCIGSATDQGPNPGRYLLPVSAGGLLLAGASWLGVGAVAALSGSAWAVLIAATFFATSVALAYRARPTDDSELVDLP